MAQLVAGWTAGRYALDGRELTSGSVIELLVSGRWVACRVEWDDGMRVYYGLVCQQPGDGGTLRVALRLGTIARWPAHRGV